MIFRQASGPCRFPRAGGRHSVHSHRQNPHEQLHGHRYTRNRRIMRAPGSYGYAPVSV